MTKHQDSESRDSRARHPSRRVGRRDVEHLLDRLRPEHILPEETYGHLQQAGREQLLAIRSLIDALIDRLDPSEQHVRSADRDASHARRLSGRTPVSGAEEGDVQSHVATYHPPVE